MLFDDNLPSENKKQTVNSWGTNEEDNIQQFSSISVWSIISVILGIISLVNIINHSLFWIPLITIVMVIWSFWLINHSEGELTGKGFLRVSLFLSLVSLIEAPIQDSIYSHVVVKQAKEFFPMVIDAVKRGDTLELYQLRNWQFNRETIKDEIQFWKGQMNDPAMSINMAEFVRNKGLVTLVNLGDSAEITYDRLIKIDFDRSSDNDIVTAAYAVTYSEFGKKKTFLIPFTAVRNHDAKRGVSFWRLHSVGKEPLHW